MRHDVLTALFPPLCVCRLSRVRANQLTPGTCVHVEAGQKHSLKNNGDVDMVLFYFGIAVEPATGDGGGGVNNKGRNGGVGNALHPIGP